MNAIDYPSPRLTFTVEEVAVVLGIGRTLAYEGVRTGAIPSVRVGRRVLVPKAALDRLLVAEKTVADAPLRSVGSTH
jgi:excisionase family DNA binding protein